MEYKVYVWLNDNIDKYNFLDENSLKIKEAFSNSIIEHRDNETVEIAYNNFVQNFYNNIIGFKNGFANKGIVADSLDCYFVNTSDGMIPIGYYKENRPVEAAMLVQKYMEICEQCIPTEKNKLVMEWQGEIEKIGEEFQGIKEKKYSGIKKATTSVVFSGILLVLSIISFFMAGGFGAVSGNLDSQTVTNIQSIMPCLMRATAGEINTFAVFMMITGIMATLLTLFFVYELKLALDRKSTEELLNNSHSTVKNIEDGINDDLKNKSEEMRSAIRQGRDLTVEKNNNSNEIELLNKKIKIAKKYVKRFLVHSHIAVLITLIVVTCCMPICFTRIIPNIAIKQVYNQAVQMMDDKEYSKAAEKFKTIESYMDSTAKVDECNYLEGKRLLDEGKTKEAKVIFSKMKGYKESDNLVKECDYQAAKKNIENDEYLMAYDVFLKLGEYKDSKKQLENLKEPLYEKGKEAYQDEKYSEAKRYFEKSEDYEKEVDYLKLIDAHSGELEDISEIYYLIDFEDTKDILMEDSNAIDFLEGRWTNSSGKYLTYTKTGENSSQTSYNIPWTEGTNYKIEDSIHYHGSNSSGWTKQWSIKIIDVNTIELYCYKDYQTYILSRN